MSTSCTCNLSHPPCGFCIEMTAEEVAVFYSQGGSSGVMALRDAKDEAFADEFSAQKLAMVLDAPFAALVTTRAEGRAIGPALDVAWKLDELGARTRWTEIANKLRDWRRA